MKVIKVGDIKGSSFRYEGKVRLQELLGYEEFITYYSSSPKTIEESLDPDCNAMNFEIWDGGDAELQDQAIEESKIVVQDFLGVSEKSLKAIRCHIVLCLLTLLCACSVNTLVLPSSALVSSHPVWPYLNSNVMSSSGHVSPRTPGMMANVLLLMKYLI